MGLRPNSRQLMSFHGCDTVCALHNSYTTSKSYQQHLVPLGAFHSLNV